MSEPSQESEVQTNTPAFVRVHSMVRRRETRRQRAQSARRHRFKQYILGGSRRLIRGRYVQITWGHMLRHRAELLDKWHKGLVEVRLPNGAPVDLRSLEVLPARAPAPRPDFRLDSAAYDLPQGRPIEQVQGGVPSSDPLADDFAQEIAREKAEEAARKGAGDAPKDEGELEGLFKEIDQDVASGEAEPVMDEQASAEGSGAGEVAEGGPNEYTFDSTAATFEQKDGEAPVEAAPVDVVPAAEQGGPEGSTDDGPVKAEPERRGHKGKKGKGS